MSHGCYNRTCQISIGVDKVSKPWYNLGHNSPTLIV
jgi:hypothetical protein